jgi:N-acetylmuramoyl-L-alanine amidase
MGAIILTDPTKPPDATPSGAVPEVVPERHIAPEMPADAQLPAEPQADTAADTATPQFIEPGGKTPAYAVRPTRHEHKRQSQKVKAPGASSQAPSQPRARKERFRLVTVVSALRAVIVTFAAAVIVSTIFMWWTSPDFLPAQARRELAPVQATAQQIAAVPTALPTPVWFNRIGVLAGHSGIASRGPTKGNPDPGTMCSDGFSEESVTTAVAGRVVAILRGRGFTVDLLEEWDMKLFGYEAAAFISLHADSCEEFGYGGFKSTYSSERETVREQDMKLDDCVRANYGSVTGLAFRPDNITDNMRRYHAFREISPTTPGVILELGFLSHDRDLLQNHPDTLAQGIVNGLLCYLQSEQPALAPVALPTRTLDPRLELTPTQPLP